MLFLELDEDFALLSRADLVTVERLRSIVPPEVLASCVGPDDVKDDSILEKTLLAGERALVVQGATWLLGSVAKIYGRRFVFQGGSLGATELLASRFRVAIEVAGLLLSCDMAQVHVELSDVPADGLALPNGYFGSNFLLRREQHADDPDDPSVAVLDGAEPWLARALAEARYLTNLEHSSTSASAARRFDDFLREAEESVAAIREGRVRCFCAEGHSVSLRAVTGRVGPPSFIWVAPHSRGKGVAERLLQTASHKFADHSALGDVISVSNIRSLALFRKCGFKVTGLMVNKSLETI